MISAYTLASTAIDTVGIIAIDLVSSTRFQGAILRSRKPSMTNCPAYVPVIVDDCPAASSPMAQMYLVPRGLSSEQRGKSSVCTVTEGWIGGRTLHQGVVSMKIRLTICPSNIASESLGVGHPRASSHEIRRGTSSSAVQGAAALACSAPQQCSSPHLTARCCLEHKNHFFHRPNHKHSPGSLAGDSCDALWRSSKSPDLA